MCIRALILGALATIVALPTPASACAPFRYEDAVAEARVRGADGRWRPLHIEVSDSLMRLEYDSTRSASGRVGIVFNVEGRHGVVFPAPGPYAPPRQAQVAVSMPFEAALTGLGLPRSLFGRVGDTYLPIERAGPFTCSRDTSDPSVCVIIPSRTTKRGGAGLPAYALDKAGRRYFEIVSVRYREVARARFERPPGFAIAGEGHALRGSCGAGG